MVFIKKNEEGKVTHILGVEAELVVGLLLLGIGVLGVLWAHLDFVFDWLKKVSIE